MSSKPKASDDNQPTEAANQADDVQRGSPNDGNVIVIGSSSSSSGSESSSPANSPTRGGIEVITINSADESGSSGSSSSSDSSVRSDSSSSSSSDSIIIVKDISYSRIPALPANPSGSGNPSGSAVVANTRSVATSTNEINFHNALNSESQKAVSSTHEASSSAAVASTSRVTVASTSRVTVGPSRKPYVLQRIPLASPQHSQHSFDSDCVSSQSSVIEIPIIRSPTATNSPGPTVVLENPASPDESQNPRDLIDFPDPPGVHRPDDDDDDVLSWHSFAQSSPSNSVVIADITENLINTVCTNMDVDDYVPDKGEDEGKG